jgi:predicted nucleic acid-binding protein
MNVVDSSGWLEYFANGGNASFFAPAIQKPAELLVPSLSLYKVFKRILQQRDETDALQAMAAMQQGRLVDLDAAIALAAAKISVELRLPMADSIILATARAFHATLWTQDADFAAIEGVKYVQAKPKTPPIPE